MAKEAPRGHQRYSETVDKREAPRGHQRCPETVDKREDSRASHKIQADEAPYGHFRCPNTMGIKDENFGQVQIADEVVAIIAGLAATEVEGVASMAGNITNELVSKLGMKNLSKGVKVMVEEDIVQIDLALNIDFGYSVPKTCKKVQEKVKASIENMTGLTVSDVNIRIASVSLEKRN